MSQDLACVFCNKIAAGEAEEFNTMGVYHFEPLNPVTPGHRLFVPREHIAEARLSSGITGLLFSAATQYAQKNEEDFNLIVNSGPAASQSIRHLHIHYVPRRTDDGLNLPWTGQQKGHFGGFLGPNPDAMIDEAKEGLLKVARELDGQKVVIQMNDERPSLAEAAEMARRAGMVQGRLKGLL